MGLEGTMVEALVAFEHAKLAAGRLVSHHTADDGDLLFFAPQPVRDSQTDWLVGVLISKDLGAELLGQEPTQQNMATLVDSVRALILQAVNVRSDILHRGRAPQDLGGTTIGEAVEAQSQDIIHNINPAYNGRMRLLTMGPVETDTGPLLVLLLCKQSLAEKHATRTVNYSITLKGVQEEGNDGVTLFHPISKCLRTGEGIGQLDLLFLNPDDPEPQTQGMGRKLSDAPDFGDLRYLGALAFTPGNRICFFPGIQDAGIPCIGSEPDAKPLPDNIRLDHLTAEPTKSRWHATLLDEKGQKVNGNDFGLSEVKLADLGPVQPWIMMTLRRASHLYAMAQENRLQVALPARDYDRRLRNVNRALESAGYHILHWADNCDAGEDSFWMFTMVLTTPDVDELPGWEMPAGVLPVEGPVTSRINFVDTPDTKRRVLLGIGKIPGTIESPAGYYSLHAD